MEHIIDSVKDEKLKKYLELAYAISKFSDDLVITGSLSQFLHLEKLHRNITDIDIVIPSEFPFLEHLDKINEELSSNYKESSYFKYSRDGYKTKLVSTINHKNKMINDYISMDVKSFPEPFEVKDNVKLVLYEKLVSNKIATSLIGDGVNHYLRVKDLYDLNFLLNDKEYDFDKVVYYLASRLHKNGIKNVYETFMFKDEAEKAYLKNYNGIKDKYGLNEKVNLMFIKEYLEVNGNFINKNIAKVKEL